MTRPEFHITVATAWVPGRTSIDVSHEIELVKSALLYADRVTLASPRVAMLAAFSTLVTADPRERSQVALSSIEAAGNSSLAAEVRAVRRKRGKSRDEIFRLRDVELELRHVGDELTGRVERLLDDAGVAELARAMAAGVLELDPLGADECGTLDGMPARLADLLAEVVSPASTTYPLLDDSTSAFLRAMLAEGRVPGAALQAAKEPALAASWIGDVAAVPGTEMAAVLEAREALRAPLAHFRSAVLRVSRSLEATPLDEEWRRAAEEAFRLEVAPAIAELEEQAESMRFAHLLRYPKVLASARHLGGAVGFVGGAAVAELGLIGAVSSAVPAIIGAALGVAGDVGAALAARHQELAEAPRENAYFFLYRAREVLGR